MNNFYKGDHIMKRSEINAILRESVDFVAKMGYFLPPFAYWSKEDWAKAGSEYDEIRDCMLGWDVTDFGSGDFAKIGLVAFTIRNGKLNSDKYIKPYAEKLLLVRQMQATPNHFHYNKMEDIINRGGGDLCVTVYNSTPDYRLADTPVIVFTDGRKYSVPAGHTVRIAPGESITLPAYQYHTFWAEGGNALIGEVSKVNDDNVDNNFLPDLPRFAKIIEDEAPLYPLCNEYA